MSRRVFKENNDGDTKNKVRNISKKKRKTPSAPTRKKGRNWQKYRPSL